ncbi:hypothetical protein FB451DRAFT_1239749 [Mycena latifolia]|nr:hypothetical protein FB451DRAFT_1239749 [Mycena latifolia]
MQRVEREEETVVEFQVEEAECNDQVLSHIQRLPNEITAEIFTQFLPPYPERSPLVGPLSPSFLCRICRHWRDVAVSTPSLWCALSLYLEDDYVERYEQELHLLETWLERSGNCPLSIALEITVDESMNRFIESTVRHSARWQHMTLLLPNCDLYLVKGDMPRLRSLTFGPNQELYDSEPIPEPAILFDQAPNLVAVELRSFFNPFSIVLPWSQITTLSGSLLDSEVAQILRHAANVQECTFELYPGVQLVHPIAAISPLLRMCALSLMPTLIRRNIPMTHLLAALTLPELRIIKVHEPFLGTNPIQTLTALGARRLERIEVESRRFASAGEYTAAFPGAIITVENW